MKKKYYILVLTFLCMLCGQVSYGQFYYSEQGDDTNDPCDFSSSAYDFCECLPEAETCNIIDLDEVIIKPEKPEEPEDSGDCHDPLSSEYPCVNDDDTDPLDEDECDPSNPDYLGDCACYGYNCGDEIPTEIDLDCNTFAERIKDILTHEGGYVNNPNDPGKETNKGITIAVWQENAQSLLNIEPTSANLKALTDTQAAVLYKALYWDKIQAEDIVDGDIRYLLFDFFVNSGGNAVKVIQKTLNQLGNNLSIDGAIGDNTINAINNTNAVQLYNDFKTDRQQYYNNLASRSTKMATFLNGWTNRVNKFKNKTTTNNINVNCN